MKVGSTEHNAIPVLLSKSEKYNARRRDEFFDYIQLYFMLVHRDDKSNKFQPLYDGDKPRLVTMRELSGFMEQVGRNTGYIIHPEEILADNFALLVLNERRIRSPEIIKKMRKILEVNRDKTQK